MAVRVEIHKFCKGYAMADGMKVFLESGEEIKDIAYFEMPKTSVNDIMTITLTIPVTDIKFLDKTEKV